MNYQDGYSKTGRSLFAHVPRAAQKWAARCVNTLLEQGHISKPDACEMCGRSAGIIDCHHTDYSKPYHICWLCRSCHRPCHYSPSMHTKAVGLCRDIRPDHKRNHWPKRIGGPVRKSAVLMLPFGPGFDVRYRESELDLVPASSPHPAALPGIAIERN